MRTGLVAAVKAAYERQLGEVIEHPAIYTVIPKQVDCRGNVHLTRRTTF